MFIQFIKTNLFWKEKHPPLATNKPGCLGRLNSLLQNLKRNDQFNTYNIIIRDQQENETVEQVDEKSQCQNNGYYIPPEGSSERSSTSNKSTPSL